MSVDREVVSGADECTGLHWLGIVRKWQDVGLDVKVGIRMGLQIRFVWELSVGMIKRWGDRKRDHKLVSEELYTVHKGRVDEGTSKANVGGAPWWDKGDGGCVGGIGRYVRCL